MSVYKKAYSLNNKYRVTHRDFITVEVPPKETGDENISYLTTVYIPTTKEKTNVYFLYKKSTKGIDKVTGDIDDIISTLQSMKKTADKMGFDNVYFSQDGGNYYNDYTDSGIYIEFYRKETDGELGYRLDVIKEITSLKEKEISKKKQKKESEERKKLAKLKKKYED